MSAALEETFAPPRYAVAPDVLLAPDGVREDAVMLVEGGTIIAVADRAEFARAYPETDIAPLPGRAVIPGFIDAHIHLGQGFGKSIIGGEPSQIWRRIWIPLESRLDPELSYVCAKWMFLEALRGGFTGVVNFAIINREKTEAIHRAARETGVRLVSSTGAVNKPVDPGAAGDGPGLKQIDEALARAESHMELCRRDPGIYPSLCVSGVEGASKELIGGLADFCAERGALFQIHANEHVPEVHASVVEHGRRPVEFIADCRALGRHTLLHHATLVTESEIELIRSTESAVSYNPVASHWKGDAVSPACAYVERGVRLGLGTDSTRCDGFRMLDAAESCQRIAFGMRVNDFSCGAAWTWVDAATRGSADACGLGKVAGRLAPGYRADFLVLDMEVPEVLPSWDFEWDLVRHYNRDQIRAVVVDGTLVMQDGRATGWDQERFLKEQLPVAIETVREAPIVRRHGTSGQHRAARRTTGNA